MVLFSPVSCKFLLHFTWFSLVILLISYVKNLVAKICYTIVFHSENEAVVVVVATEALRTNGSTQNIYMYVCICMQVTHTHAPLHASTAICMHVHSCLCMRAGRCLWVCVCVGVCLCDLTVHLDANLLVKHLIFGSSISAYTHAYVARHTYRQTHTWAHAYKSTG